MSSRIMLSLCDWLLFITFMNAHMFIPSNSRFLQCSWIWSSFFVRKGLIWIPCIRPKSTPCVVLKLKICQKIQLTTMRQCHLFKMTTLFSLSERPSHLVVIQFCNCNKQKVGGRTCRPLYHTINIYEGIWIMLFRNNKILFGERYGRAGRWRMSTINRRNHAVTTESSWGWWAKGNDMTSHIFSGMILVVIVTHLRESKDLHLTCCWQSRAHTACICFILLCIAKDRNTMS